VYKLQLLNHLHARGTTLQLAFSVIAVTQVTAKISRVPEAASLLIYLERREDDITFDN
jgi:hypothetical protein